MEVKETNTYSILADARSRVITIEYIVGATENPELVDCIEYLRQYGTAAVVSDVMVAESYDDAGAILAMRMLVGSP